MAITILCLDDKYRKLKVRMSLQFPKAMPVFRILLMIIICKYLLQQEINHKQINEDIGADINGNKIIGQELHFSWPLAILFIIAMLLLA